MSVWVGKVSLLIMTSFRGFLALLLILVSTAAPTLGRQCLVYPEATSRALRVRVDDDVAVFQGSQMLVNTHIIPSGQWRNVYDLTLTTNLLVLTAYDWGNPCGILLTIDGQTTSLDQWKCNTLSSMDQLQNPEDAYPGVLGLDFDDSSWNNAVGVSNDEWGGTGGFPDNNAWFWANPASLNLVVCRLKLAECEQFATDAPTAAPTAPPTAAPTEAPTCVKQRAMWAESGIPVDEPALTEGCKFELKQCNAEKCFCVTTKKGKRRFGVEVPLGNAYDCTKRPKRCQKKLFNLLIKNKSGFIPVCVSSGHYETKQCHKGECWCVKPKGGKERKNTRTTGDLKC